MAIAKTLIDQLLADYKKPEVIGEKGLLKRLTKTILERAFEAGRSEGATLWLQVLTELKKPGG